MISQQLYVIIRNCLLLLNKCIYLIAAMFLEVVHNCQHYQKCTQTTLLCDPLPSKRVL